MSEMPLLSRVSRITPVLDFSFLMILMTLGTGALYQLTTPAEPEACAAETAPKSADRQDLYRQIDRLAEQLRELQAAFESARQEAERLEQLAASPEYRPDLETLRRQRNELRKTFEKLQDELARTQQTIDALQADRQRFQQQRKELEGLYADLEALAQALEATERKTRALEQECRSLEHQIEASSRQTVRVESIPLARQARGRKPVYVILASGAVAPLREPYFARQEKILQRGAGQFEGVTVFTRQQAGQPIQEALQPGSTFSGLLDQIDGQRSYAALLVDSDSFETFRALREQLRKRRIPFGWEPYSRSSVTLTAEGQEVLAEEEK